MMKSERTCPNGHRYVKSSDCPTCPQCEAMKAPKDGWMAKLSAPARRALESAGIRTLRELSEYTEKELLAFHGFGPFSIPTLRKALAAAGLQFTARTIKTMRDTVKKPTNTNEYLAQLPADQRRALRMLRERILAAVPGTTEEFAYGVPAFRYNGHPLVYMGAAKHHCGLYGSVPPGFRDALKGFTIGKGSIQFTPDRPIPADVLKELLRSKAAEIEVRWPAKTKKTATKKTAKKAAKKK